MGETLTPKATIVVPVYNSSRSIQRCLDSLLAQSERSIQVVCVNDGSTDDSLNVLRQIAQADDRVLVIDQENAGVSCARNAGIDAAEGETVFFVDADDYIDAQTVERVLHAMESADAEAAVFGGIGSIPGAVIGAFIIGICENLLKGMKLTAFSDAFTFALLIIILVVKPTGLFGEKLTEKV